MLNSIKYSKKIIVLFEKINHKNILVYTSKNIVIKNKNSDLLL